MAVASQLFTNVYPVFIGALATSGRATPAQLGRLVAVEYFCMALTAWMAGKLIPLPRLRGLALIASWVQLAAVVATTYVSGDQLLPVRAIFASACGIQVCIQYEFIARSQKPGQLVGLCTTIVVITAVLMSWLGSSYVLPTFGITGLILFFGLPSLPAIPGALMLPRMVAGSATHAQTTVPSTATVSSGSLVLLASVFFWSAWISTLWVYSEPLAETIGISETASRVFVVTALISSLGGAALATVVAERLPFGRILSGGLLLCLTQVIAILAGVGSVGYVIWFSVFGFLGYFLIPFFVKALVAADVVERQSVVFFPAAQYAGAALGPLAASFAVSPGQFRGGVLVDLGCIAMAIGTLWIGLFHIRRISRKTTG
jgi:hypothetical protein